MTDQISEKDFVDTWGAKAQESGDLFTYDQIKNQDCRKVWSIVEGGEDENWYALAGFHVVNMLGYVLTDQPWETGLEQAIWFEEDGEKLCVECGAELDGSEDFPDVCNACDSLDHPEGTDGYPDDYADAINGHLED